MSLRDEIAALRAELETRNHRTLAEETSPGSSSPGTPRQRSSDSNDPVDAEGLLKIMSDTLDEFAEELDRFPRLTALAALGVGLAVGVVIGRQLR